MWQVILLATLFSTVTAQSDGNGGWFCNYTAGGDETVQEAYPIKSFATSGANQTRPQWCIAYCADRTSIKSTMLFKPSHIPVPRFNRQYRRDRDGVLYNEVTPVRSGKFFKTIIPPSRWNCINPEVYKSVDEVFEQNQGASVDVLAEQLAVTINKPGWAYLVYELSLDSPSVIFFANTFEDFNFCTKEVIQTINGDDIIYQVVAGLIHS